MAISFSAQKSFLGLGDTFQGSFFLPISLAFVPLGPIVEGDREIGHKHFAQSKFERRQRNLQSTKVERPHFRKV